MSRSAIHRTVVLVTLAALSFAQPSTPAESTRMLLMAELSSDQIAVGQPVYISLRLRNISRDVTTTQDTSLEWDFDIRLVDSAGKVVPRIHSAANRTILRNTSMGWDPGSEQISVLSLGDIFALNTPGEYTVSVARSQIYGSGKGYEQASAVPMSLTVTQSPDVSRTLAKDPWAAQRSARQALFNSLSEMELSAPTGTLTVNQYEPLIVPLTLFNQSFASVVQFEAGPQADREYRVEVLSPDGRTSRHFAPEWVNDISNGTNTRINLQPGAQFVRPTLLNEWVRFDTTGIYQVRIAIPRCKSVATINVNVLSADPVRLQEIMTRLAEESLALDPGLLSLRALASIGREAALPFLLRIVKGGNSLAISALSGIDSSSAVDALLELRSTGSDYAKSTADRALKKLRDQTTSPAVREKIDAALANK